MTRGNGFRYDKKGIDFISYIGFNELLHIVSNVKKTSIYSMY